MVVPVYICAIQPGKSSIRMQIDQLRQPQNKSAPIKAIQLRQWRTANKKKEKMKPVKISEFFVDTIYS